MIAGTYNFTIDQGSTFNRSITVTNSDGSFYDFTGHTARMQIRRELPDADVMLEFTTQNSRITLGGASGTIQLYATDEATSTLTRDGVYDLEIETATGEVFRLIQGVVRVNLEVTR